jgi:imidazole glycerol phosphate synthase subunit HisF
MRLRARLLVTAVLSVCLGCGSSIGAPLRPAPVVKVETRPGLGERTPFHKVAVGPFSVTPNLARRTDPDSPSSDEAAALVARHVAEAMEQRGVDVIPAGDVRRATEDAGLELSTPELARLVAERFGAEALLVGKVLRYQERVGQAAGSTRPAAVGFEVTLYGAPEGERLWRATFDERQQALSENVFNAARYPGRGSRALGRRAGALGCRRGGAGDARGGLVTFEVIPAIDLLEGRCVNLVQGRYDRATVFGDDPVEVAERFLAHALSRLHLVDLDGAREGKPGNLDCIRAILAASRGVPVQLGGGIRDLAVIESCLGLGLERVILGTVALREPDLVREAARRFPGRVAVGIDARDVARDERGGRPGARPALRRCRSSGSHPHRHRPRRYAQRSESRGLRGARRSRGDPRGGLGRGLERRGRARSRLPVIARRGGSHRRTRPLHG